MDTLGINVELPNGATMVVRAHGADQGATDVGGLGALPFAQVRDSVEGLSKTILDAIRAAAPSEATIELGLDLQLESGKLTSVLVDGSAAATLRITLCWRAERPG